MNIKKIFTILVHAFIGWALCTASMVIGMAIMSLKSALIVHAIGAPIHWLAPKANIEFRRGGAFEFFWGDNPERDSTLGCKLLEIEHERYLRFEWQGKTEFLHMFFAAPWQTNYH